MDLERRKQIALIGAVLVSLFLFSQIPRTLAPLPTTLDPGTFLIRLSLLLFMFVFPISAGWLGAKNAGGLVFSGLASVAVLFSWSVTRSPLFLWLLPAYGLLSFLLRWLEQRSEDRLSLLRVELEKGTSEKNDLEVEYRQRGESVSIFFEKYSTYYNLRKLAEDFAARISLGELSQLIVNRTLEFIPRGEGCFLALAAKEGAKLSVVASRKVKGAVPAKRKEGDLFDLWVIRSRKRLLVTDTQKDFRFDARHIQALSGEMRSLISAPLLHEGRVLGALRLHSSKPETFTTDDLRLLDAISTLASSALSNAMLFEKTQDLAIRDSLTSLYVQRHFFERLREEHHRALRSGKALSLLMCDLDHFKVANDRWGHGAGDLMLVRFAQILREEAEGGVLARYGGEEFTVLLPQVVKEKAASLAERIRKAMEGFSFSIRRQKVKMTVSIGVASLPVDTLDEEDLVKKADEALYQAKHQGRNGVVSWAPR